MLIHIPDIVLAEVSSVKDEADLFILIFLDLINHINELGNICDRARILLVEQRYLVILVKSNANIEYRKAFVVLGFPVFNEVNISCLTILIGRVIGDIDLLGMIPLFIPVIEKAYCLLPVDRFQKATDCYITVNSHLVREQWMTEGEIRIILASIVFINNEIGNQIKEQAAILLEMFLQHLRNVVLVQHFLNDDVGTNPQCAAAICFRSFFWHNCVREEFLVLLIWIHESFVFR